MPMLTLPPLPPEPPEGRLSARAAATKANIILRIIHLLLRLRPSLKIVLELFMADNVYCDRHSRSCGPPALLFPSVISCVEIGG